jgi:hypothetical protein
MLDSQNVSISDLKAEVARSKAALQGAEEAAGRAASEWKERLRDEIEQVSLRQCVFFWSRNGAWKYSLGHCFKGRCATWCIGMKKAPTGRG